MTDWLTPARSRNARMSSADKWSTAVKERTSNSRMVFLSTRPSRCMPRTPSCTALAISLRYLRLVDIVQLRQLLSGEHLSDAARIERQQQRSVVFQISLVVPTEVRLIAFGEAEQEHRATADAIGNHGAESTASAFPRTRNSLLDEPVTEIGVDQ